MGEEGMASGLRNTDSVFKVFLLAFFLFWMWTGRSYPEKSRLFPDLLSGAGIILIILSFITGLVKPKKQKIGKAPLPSSDTREEKLRWVKEMEEESEKDAGFELLEKSERKRRLWQSILIVIISLAIGYLGGFLLIVPFYFITFGILHGKKKQTFRYVIIAFGVSLVVYGFFTSLMGVPLLKGICWG